MMGRILGPFGIEDGTTASPRPLVASWTTMGRALASNTIRGVKPGLGAGGVQRRPHAGAAGQADQRQVAQRADRDRAGVGERVAGVDHRDQFLVHDDHGVDVRRGLSRPADQGEVELAVPEPLDQAVGVVLDQRDGHARVAVVEAGQEFGQDGQRAAADHAHRDLPAHQAGQLVDGQPGVGHRVQGGPREREHGRPHLGQPDRTAGPVQQLLPELGLQPADLRAHPGLRHVHPARRPGEAGLLGDHHEASQPLQVDVVTRVYASLVRVIHGHISSITQPG